MSALSEPDLTRTRRWLVLPIETKVREFHGRLLLGALAAEAGFHVLLGDQNVLLRHRARLPRGLYIDKSVARTKTGHFQRLREQGFRIGAWCEEGLIYLEPEIYLSERVSLDSLNRIDRFFAWGPRQANDMKAVAGAAADRIVATGNPRMDMLRADLRPIHDDSVAAIRRRFARFVLINTNFARYNHYLGEFHMLTLQRQRGIVKTEAERARLCDWCEHIKDQFDSFVAMLPLLAAALPDRRIVLRPHPSEDFARWQAVTAGLGSVEIRHEGPAIPWMLAADAVVHAACSTGFEAAILGRPTFSYRPRPSDRFDAAITVAASTTVATPEALIEGIRAAPDATGAAPAADLAQVLTGLDGDLACARIRDAFADLDLPELAWDVGGGLGATWIEAKQQAKRAARRALRVGIAPGYASQKFPGLAPDEVRDALGRLSTLAGIERPIAAAPAPGMPDSYILGAA